MTFKWRNLFHFRTYAAPFLAAGIVLTVLFQISPLEDHLVVAAFIFWPIFAVCLLLMLFGTPLECSNCGQGVPHGRTVCKRCGAPVGTAAMD